MPTTNAQGGMGLTLTMGGTAIASVLETDELNLTRLFRDITGHDSEEKYYDEEPSGLRRIDPFTCKLAWDFNETTHAAILTALTSNTPSTFIFSDPLSIEGISFSAYIEAIGHIFEQEGLFTANVTIHPVSAPTIALPEPEYYERVLATSPSNLVAYWPLWETAGSEAEQIAPTSIPNGSYYGVTLANTLGPDGLYYAPLWDAINDYLNIYSTQLNTAWNAGMGDEGTIIMWIKSDDAFATAAGSFWRISYSNDYFNWFKQHFDGTPGKIESLMERITTLRHTVTGATQSGWNMIAQSWLYPGTFRTFWDGSYFAQSTANGPWTGNLLTEYTVIGNMRAHPNANGGFGGWIAHTAFWNTQLSDAVIEALAVI